MKKKRDPLKEQEHRDEAERLAQLPREDQAAVVAMYRHLAGNPLATKACRDSAKEQAAALEMLLGLRRTRKPATGPRGTREGKALGKRGPKR